jgi:cardiolipin synthase A/B
MRIFCNCGIDRRVTGEPASRRHGEPREDHADVLDALATYWQEITAWTAVIDAVLIVTVVPWVLAIKKEAISAIAWCLLVVFIPIFGAIFFVLFGYQSVHRPLKRKRRHRESFRVRNPAGRHPIHAEAEQAEDPDDTWEGMGRLARRLDAYPVTTGNKLTFYHEGKPAFDDMLAAIRAAEHHVHLEFFIFQYDGLGRRFLDLLTEKAKQGVEVRLLYDAMGSRQIGWWRLRKLRRAGGRHEAFLPLSLLRRRIQVNMRNHRKVLVVDGRVAFTGGVNIGDEYLGKNKRLGFWRDTTLKVEGPAVESLQRTFIEDWDFAAGESLEGGVYFRADADAGDDEVQVIQAGPDQEVKAIREVYFAAVFKARKRLWVTSPYYVPDQGLRDALCLAGRTGIDVRLLLPFEADHTAVHFASQYYLPELLEAGVKVYLYTNGFIHSKVWLADGQWASVGTANLDNRSLLLNFEVNCLIYTPRAVAELEEQFQRDLKQSIRLEQAVFKKRPVTQRLAENFFRLFSPVL